MADSPELISRFTGAAFSGQSQTDQQYDSALDGK